MLMDRYRLINKQSDELIGVFKDYLLFIEGRKIKIWRLINVQDYL